MIVMNLSAVNELVKSICSLQTLLLPAYVSFATRDAYNDH